MQIASHFTYVVSISCFWFLVGIQFSELCVNVGEPYVCKIMQLLQALNELELV